MMKIGCVLIFGMVIAMASPPARNHSTNTSKNIPLQEQRWNAAKVKPGKQSEVRWIARKIERNKSRYQSIEKTTGVKWFVIACLHNMECGLNFKKHLHNGDLLTRRTYQVPKGRPKTGSPPFSFEFSAKDALFYDGMHKVNWNDLNAALNALEEYNGTGYRKYHPTIPTPYLYSATTIEKPGKYVADGKWSSTAVSKQIGIVAILKELNVKF